jgi:tetraacyldisaccharide 4'-kinase
VSAIQYLKGHVEDVMTANGPAPFRSLATGLYVISVFYGAMLKLRAFAYRQNLISTLRLACKVICVGNISVGGTGKTPMAMHVARTAKQLGYVPAVVSRGYRGEAEQQGGIVSDGRSIRMGPHMAGDEPFMMATKLDGIPVIIGKNRCSAAKIAVDQFQANVIVLDDGYQHLKLERDIDLVLLDYASPFGNSHLLPRGTLREPLSSLERATACILTRCQDGDSEAMRDRFELIHRYSPQVPIFTSSHQPYWYTVESGRPINLEGLSNEHFGRKRDGVADEAVYGFSGIARNADFQDAVINLGFNAKGFLEFPDHHRYTASDLMTIRGKASDADVRRLITTEKDLVRLVPCNPFPLELIVVGVEISLGEDQAKFSSFLKQHLAL